MENAVCLVSTREVFFDDDNEEANALVEEEYWTTEVKLISSTQTTDSFARSIESEMEIEWKRGRVNFKWRKIYMKKKEWIEHVFEGEKRERTMYLIFIMAKTCSKN